MALTRNHLVVQTFMVCHKREATPRYYQVELAQTDNPRERRLVFITTDAALYEHALSIEGTEARVDVSWMVGQKANGQPAQILIGLKRAERQRHERREVSA